MDAARKYRRGDVMIFEYIRVGLIVDEDMLMKDDSVYMPFLISAQYPIKRGTRYYFNSLSPQKKDCIFASDLNP